MNYIEAMKQLSKYRENKRTNGRELTPAYNFVVRMKQRAECTDTMTKDNLVQSISSLLNQSNPNSPSRLGEEIKSGCALLGQAYTNELQKSTSAYESCMLKLQQNTAEEIRKGTPKPLSQCSFKLFGAIMLGIIAVSAFIAGVILAMSKITTVGLALGAIVIFMCTSKKKPNEAALTSLVSEARSLTKKYYTELVSIIEPAYGNLEAQHAAEAEREEEQIKAMVGERVFYLFESTPYNQQEYFIKLGATASSEEDFNEIARECLKADKSEELVNRQTMAQIETRNSINKSLEKLNKTAQQMHEDAEFRARQQADHNAQVAKQNERNLANQAKALDQMKKAQKQVDDIDYRMRNQ